MMETLANKIGANGRFAGRLAVDLSGLSIHRPHPVNKTLICTGLVVRCGHMSYTDSTDSTRSHGSNLYKSLVRAC
ncbi:hypothetical protein RRG08_052703 [Elysia crispata]|uniref:Uncharacterized protein n=1 Tax=Elysia crispata TaxID=231223 RepID=A0AAE1B4T2_9GAST|nr:hypothetical protein RRG08_052703 [Elysia crispata]